MNGTIDILARRKNLRVIHISNIHHLNDYVGRRVGGIQKPD
ncbi:MAG: hypothetical protein R2875_07080 [Desulfobacterales bacterium]